MKKWEKSTKQIILLQDLKKTRELPWDIQIKDKDCDGIVTRTSYHDGTLLFTNQLIWQAIEELIATDTKYIGAILLKTDYVFCNMKYGNNRPVSRDTITIKFKYT